ncbi:hypothetical protein [Stenotrophomonas sp. PA-6-5C]|uniref:hypothetical protein n=1 Tax=Stenotrophomonas sp. PA-6-5C TaxID=2665487 RepID=UPI001F3FED92|nr:hypothetical protein [Stenotrophomonas sp. PA-6-5C]
MRQLNSLRKRYESRLQDNGFSLFNLADHATLMAVFARHDPLLFSVGHRLRCKREGFGYLLGKPSRLPA